MMIERNLRRELVSDSLTGLPNRAGFEELVEMSVEGEELAEHAILLLDLARFSRINANIGPLAGDELLITVARRLKSRLRGGATMARSRGAAFPLSSPILRGRAHLTQNARAPPGCFPPPDRKRGP